MTKPKLTDAVKQPSEKLPDPAQASPAASEAGAGVVPAASVASGDKGSEEDSEGEAEQKPSEEPEEKPEAANPAVNPEAARFIAAFGEAQGCIFLVKGVSYVDACTQHMAAQAATITAQATEIAALKKTGSDLAAKLKGEAEPLATGPKGDKPPATGDAAVSDFAKSVEARLAK
jgi:hypothetical protein